MYADLAQGSKLRFRFDTLGDQSDTSQFAEIVQTFDQRCS